MSDSTPKRCQDFRELLELALRDPDAKLEPLAWHEHLLSCPKCQALLEEEKALEQLLATLPAPELPDTLVGKVLARLGEERPKSGLDALLELDQLQGPEGLTGRILDELELDRALALLPELPAPSGLSRRVLEALEPQRRALDAPALRLRRVAPLAASLLALLGLGLYALSGEEAVESPVAVGPVDERPSEEMLAVLDLLGDESLWGADPYATSEVDIALSLDESDELLLEYLAMTEEDD